MKNSEVKKLVNIIATVIGGGLVLMIKFLVFIAILSIWVSDHYEEIMSEPVEQEVVEEVQEEIVEETPVVEEEIQTEEVEESEPVVEEVAEIRANALAKQAECDAEQTEMGWDADIDHAVDEHPSMVDNLYAHNEDLFIAECEVLGFSAESAQNYYSWFVENN